MVSGSEDDQQTRSEMASEPQKIIAYGEGSQADKQMTAGEMMALVACKIG
jgi:hypothetical protein